METIPCLKIIHTTCHTEFGGLEKRIFNESSWMAEKGHDIIIAAPGNTPLYNKAMEKGFITHDVKFKRSGIVKDFLALRKLIRNFKPHVLNTHGNEDTKIALSAAMGTGIPLKILSRHISAHVGKSWYNGLLYHHLCNYVFTTADYTTRHLIKTFGIPNERVRTVSSGIIPPAILVEKAEAKKRLAKELSLDSSARFTGFVGRVSRDKGVDVVIKAFYRASSRIPHHLAIIGTGTDEYLADLRACAKDLNIEHRVHFTGFREDVWPYYRALDCKMLASRDINGIPFEGIPQSILEAMYAGCPVIGSESGGIPDVIKSGITGLLFRVDDEGDLSEKLLQTLDNEAASRARSENAFRMVQDHHTIDAMGDKILRIYRNYFTKPKKNSIPLRRFF
ncbi:MAG: glycosyl transferase group 1 [Desulfobacterales bacterium RIFOXYA12_FULL_46_15]|nr:MAG: glycosyl transferase group 1 [Desulfobacterales bacterium RIFOXYA12_FULL_46_15]